MRKMNKGVHAKWINALSAVKQELETKEISVIQNLITKYNLSTHWSSWLIKNNIIVRLNGIYHWNEKIPVSSKIINKYRKDESIRQAIYYAKHIEKKKNEQNILIKPVVSQNIKNEPIQINKDDIGIIRKFLKWLW